MIALTAMTASLMFQPAPAAQPAPDAEAAPEAQTPVDAGENVETVEVAAKDIPQKVVCKRQAIVGSKFKKRICGTEADWELLRQQSVQDAGEMQRKGKGLSPNGG